MRRFLSNYFDLLFTARCHCTEALCIAVHFLRYGTLITCSLFILFSYFTICYLCPQKVYPLMFDNNFGKCEPIFKILSPANSWENSLCIHTKTATSPAICCYTTSWKSKIQKCYWIWRHPQQTVDVFVRTLWTLDLTSDSSWTRLLTLSDWPAFWSLSDDISNQQLNVVYLNVVASWWFSSPWLSLYCVRSFYTILHVLYTYLSKIISAIFLWQVT